MEQKFIFRCRGCNKIVFTLEGAFNCICLKNKMKIRKRSIKEIDYNKIYQRKYYYNKRREVKQNDRTNNIFQ
jgi:hypothetical protein